jgi:hypothetical protein
MTQLVSAYSSCSYQGISAGWGDDYIGGLDCQWIDVTDVKVGTSSLTFAVNPDGFLCEGDPVRDASGQPVFEQFRKDDGHVVNRPRCNFSAGWQRDNSVSLPVTIPAQGSYITLPCQHGEFSPLRNCDFQLKRNQQRCTPGDQVSFAWITDEPQVVRICEGSAFLGTGTACSYRQALANAVVTSQALIAFSCPKARDAQERGGLYAVYVAPLLSP